MGALHWATWPLPAPRVLAPGKEGHGKEGSAWIPNANSWHQGPHGFQREGGGLLPSIGLTSSPWLAPAQLRTYFRGVGMMVDWTQAFTALTVAARGGLEMR